MGSKDEIVRYSIENRFTNSINLIRCCSVDPEEMFRSSTEYFVRCKQCGKQTKTFRYLYEAKQAWNRGEYDNNRNQRKDKSNSRPIL